MIYQRRWVAFTATVSAVVLGVLSGCGNRVNPAGGLTPPGLGPIPVIRDYADIKFPLEDYHLTPEHRSTVVHALNALTSSCMRRFDFDYPILEPSPIPLRDRAIGVVSAEEVAVHGYRNRAAEKFAREQQALKAKERPSSALMAAVLSGGRQSEINNLVVPAGGCTGEARRTLGADSVGAEPGTKNFLLTLEAQSSDLAEADGRLKAVFGKWQECMVESGYQYATPWGPNDDPAFRTELVTNAEITTALADVACREKHNVNGIWVAVRTAYQDRLIAQHLDGLNDHLRIKNGQVSRAGEVLTKMQTR